MLSRNIFLFHVLPKIPYNITCTIVVAFHFIALLFHSMHLVYVCELRSPRQFTLFYAGAGAVLITLLLLLIIFLSSSTQKFTQRCAGHLCKLKCVPHIETMHFLKKEESNVFAFVLLRLQVVGSDMNQT